MQQPVGQTWNGGAPISNGGAGHHWPLAGDGPGLQYAFYRFSAACDQAGISTKKVEVLCL